MRSRLLGAAVAAALLGSADPAAASALAPSARVFGDVTPRTGPPPLDAFNVSSDDTGLQDLEGAADDPEGTASSSADASFHVSSVVGGERLTTDGSAAARSGLPVREAESTSNVTTQITLTEPASYSVSGTLGRSNPEPHCCNNASVRLSDEDGNKLVDVLLDSGSRRPWAAAACCSPASTRSRSRPASATGSAPLRPTSPARRGSR
jgi:hypothetical protein